MQKHYVQRVIDWNAARYNQESNFELTVALLQEESTEFLEAINAENEVEILDAIGDIVFVGIGALWKLGVPTELIVQYYDAKCAQRSSSIIANIQHISLLTSGTTHSAKDLVLICTIVHVISGAVAFLQQAGLSEEALIDVTHAICVSNETKAVPDKLVAAGIKANAGPIGKGPNYVPPTVRLEKIAKDLAEGKYNA